MAKKLTHKRVLRIAIPIVLSNATVPILGVVDTGVVGQLGLAAPIGARYRCRYHHGYLLDIRFFTDGYYGLDRTGNRG